MLGNLWIGQPFDQEREHLILTVSEINVRMGDRGWLDQRLDGLGGQPLRIMPWSSTTITQIGIEVAMLSPIFDKVILLTASLGQSSQP